MTEQTKVGRVGAGHMMLVIASTAVAVVACGGEPKKEPTAATATATASAAPPAATASDATPSAPAASGASANTAKQAECDALVDDANSALDAERIAVDKQCKTDADCMLIKGRACAFFCATGSIPKAEEKEWNATLQKVTDDQCKKWNANECAKLRTKPAPTCQDKKPWCDKGHCALQ